LISGAHLSSHAFVLLRKPVVGVDLKLTSSLSEIDTTNLKGILPFKPISKVIF